MCRIEVFTFDGEGFKQKFGVAMGSSLSPVLANLCMEFIEIEFISNCPEDIKPLIWFRYVDDVFIIYQKDEANFNRFLDYVNNLVPSIKFTVEWEMDNKLPFLDVLVHHNPITNAFSFSVYRKPTNSEMYIHYFSYHSSQVKSNIVMNMVTRALRICDPVYLDEELLHIKSVFEKLEYPKYFVENSFSKAKRNFYNPNNERKKFSSINSIVLPFHQSLVPVKQFLDRNKRSENKDVSLVFNYKNSVRSQLVRNRSNTNESSGVYSIPCKDCNKRYFGETGRKLSTRLEEHRRDCRIGSEKSMVAKHSLEVGHRIDWEKASVIFKNNKIGERRVVEGALIHLCETFEGNKSFTQEDSLTNLLVCLAAKININEISLCTPTARSLSLSPAQVSADGNNPIAGTGTEEAIIPMELPRRSRILEARRSSNRGIT